jgi:hypothetical protein
MSKLFILALSRGDWEKNHKQVRWLLKGKRGYYIYILKIHHVAFSHFLMVLNEVGKLVGWFHDNDTPLFYKLHKATSTCTPRKWY